MNFLWLGQALFLCTKLRDEYSGYSEAVHSHVGYYVWAQPVEPTIRLLYVSEGSLKSLPKSSSPLLQSWQER